MEFKVNEKVRIKYPYDNHGQIVTIIALKINGAIIKFERSSHFRRYYELEKIND